PQPVVALPAAQPLPSRVVIDSVQPAANNTFAVAGRFIASGERPLWVLTIGGEHRVVPTAADGAFTVSLAPGERLATTGHGDEPLVLATPEPPPPAPSLDLDGPADGTLVTGDRAWYRFTAKATTGLTGLTVSADGKDLLHDDLSGVQSGGTIAIPLGAGRHTLRFVLRLKDGELVQERTITLAPTPEQDRSLRATAVMLPLQTPNDGGGLKAGDDPELLSSVSGDGRFRLVDTQADTLLAQELKLVDAGYVDRVTAAQTGQRLKTRYVLTGTLRRGRGDVECFVRLVHVETGDVVASADAYSRAVAPAQEQAFFALVAGRLRQEFPVLAGTIGADTRGIAIIDRGQNAGVVGRMRFFAVKREVDVVDPATGQVLLPGEKRVEGTLEVDQVEAQQARVKTIDGKTATGATVVSE
ncbi:MAG TPA: FlgO family outer membrane protein, partial [Planctomycetota bacterium]|nr:FlgO family outer membrane protein [Planctomycetota bacterium]